MTAQHPPRGLLGRLALLHEPSRFETTRPRPSFRHTPGGTAPAVRAVVYDAHGGRGRPIRKVAIS